MTDEERWKAEGRTRDALRETKRQLAALRSEIEDYASKLENASGSLKRFLAQPLGPGPTGMSSLQYPLHFFRPMLASEIEKALQDFEREAEKLAKLERAVKEFGE